MSCNYFDGLSRQVSTAFKGIFLSFILGVFFFLADFFPKTLSLLRFETNAAVSAKKASCQRSNYTATAAKE